MKKQLLAFSVSAALLLAACSGGGGGSPSENDGGSSSPSGDTVMSGNVVNGPLSGATVEIFNTNGELVGSTFTDTNGFYEHSGLPPSANGYRVVASNGFLNGVPYPGDLIARCEASPCGVTPLTTAVEKLAEQEQIGYANAHQQLFDWLGLEEDPFVAAHQNKPVPGVDLNSVRAGLRENPEGVTGWVAQMVEEVSRGGTPPENLKPVTGAGPEPDPAPGPGHAPDPAPGPELDPAPESATLDFPTETGVVAQENGWQVYAVVSEVDQTTSMFLSKNIDTVNGLSASIGFEALTFKEGSRSGYEHFPSPDVLPPLFGANYWGAASSYNVQSGFSAVRVEGYERRELSGLNDAIMDLNQKNFESGSYRELSVFDSPDSYKGLLDELLSSDKMFVKVVPVNQYFPTIEGEVDLEGLSEMLSVFDDLSVRRGDNIYGNSEN